MFLRGKIRTAGKRFLSLISDAVGVSTRKTIAEPSKACAERLSR